MAGAVVIGTSSWADPGFVEDWYPRGLPARERLAWYAQRFEAVELNSSFYAVPQPGLAARWASITPEGFTFDVKLHRLLSRHSASLDSLPPELRDRATTTHRGRVNLTSELEREMVAATLEAVEPLRAAGRLSSFLLQLSPAFAPREHALDELDGLVEALAGFRLAIELRHAGWVSEEERLEETLGWYEDRGVTWVSVDAPASDNPMILPPVDAVTSGSLAYLRLHGRNEQGYVSGRSVAERFGWVYADEELEEVAGRVRALAEEAGEVRVMFNNNRSNDAPTAAQRFRALFGQPSEPPSPPEDPAGEEQLRLL